MIKRICPWSIDGPDIDGLPQVIVNWKRKYEQIYHKHTMFALIHKKTRKSPWVILLVQLFLPASPKAKAGLGMQSLRPSVSPSVPKSCHRNSSETTDPIIMKLGM